MEEEEFARVTVAVADTQTGARTAVSGLSCIVVRGPLGPELHVSPYESPVILVWYGRRHKRLVETVYNLHEEEITHQTISLHSRHRRLLQQVDRGVPH